MVTMNPSAFAARRLARTSALLPRRTTLLLLGVLAACGLKSEPDEDPQTVARRFYDLITASKVEGGPAPATEAFKLIDSRSANLNVHQFLEIIKGYPSDFKVRIGKAEVRSTQALVPISFDMPSSFGGSYEVRQTIALNLDRQTQVWKIDFAGDTYGPQVGGVTKAAASGQGRP